MDKPNEEKGPKKEMTKEIDTLLNDENQMIKRVDSEHLQIKKSQYKIIENYREGLDLELFEERYSDLLDKYDFIVGDMSYGKLRLRGFYENDNRKAPIDMRISSLEDYLSEYCSFGCAYFVLESLDKKKNDKTNYRSKSSRSKNQSANRKSRQNTNKPKKSNKPTHPTSSNQKKKVKDEKRTFTKKNRSETSATKKENEKVKEVKNEKGSTRFQIRKKKE